MGFWSQAQYGSNNLQAGRDIIFPSIEDDISISEMNKIIRSFMSTKSNAEVNLKIIKIRKKNRLNGITPEYYNDIKEDSIFSYDKIEAMLLDPNNEKLSDDYFELASYLNKQYLVSNYKGNMERYIYKVICNFDENIDTLKERNWGIRLLNFMYLRCDIGIK